MRAIKVVAINTVREILRDRVLYGLLLIALMLIGLSSLLGQLSFSEQQRIIIDVGLVAGNLGCAMLAIFVGSTLVYREIDKQTVLLLISKPVKRSEFIIGKYVGLAVVLLLVDALVALLLALAVFHFGDVHWSQFFVAQGGALMESLLLLSVAVFLGTFSGPAITVISGIGFWLMGHALNDLAYFASKSPSDLFKSVGTVLPRLLPNLEYFNFREAVVYGDVIAPSTIATAVGILVAWIVILLIASIWVFNRRDFT